jgi:hypothetical protein
MFKVSPKLAKKKPNKKLLVEKWLTAIRLVKAISRFLLTAWAVAVSGFSH